MSYVRSILAAVVLGTCSLGVQAAEDAPAADFCGMVPRSLSDQHERSQVSDRLSIEDFRRYRDLLSGGELTEDQLEELKAEIGRNAQTMLSGEPGARREISPLLLSLADQLLHHGRVDEAATIYRDVFSSLMEVNERSILAIEALSKTARILARKGAVSCASHTVARAVKIISLWYGSCFLADNSAAEYLDIQRQILLSLGETEKAAKLAKEIRAAKRRVSSGKYRCPNTWTLESNRYQRSSRPNFG